MADSDVYIFSYGSNLLFQRIRERVTSVTVTGKHLLRGYSLVFNKQSVDGSTKANILKTDSPSDGVWGVLHKINLADKPILDQFEALGKGYNELTFEVEVGKITRTIYAYVATDHQYLSNGQPYDWYFDFVIKGAIENGFPEDYIEQLKTVQAKVDANLERSQENQGVIMRSSND